MNKILTVIAFLSGILLTQQSLAHAGHDHSHWLSSAIHALTLFAVLALVTTGVWMFRNSRKKSKNAQRQD